MNKDSQPPSDPALASASGYALGLPPEPDQISMRLKQYERRAAYCDQKVAQLGASDFSMRLKASADRARHFADVCREILEHNE